jgi:hypothetical protein
MPKFLILLPLALAFLAQGRPEYKVPRRSMCSGLAILWFQRVFNACALHEAHIS